MVKKMATLKELLKNKLTAEQISNLKRSYDLIGEIAVMNSMPRGLKSKEKIIAKAIMENNHHVKTVAKKIGPTSGVERIRPVKVVLGKKTTETIFVENGCRFKFDINKVYFSPRLGSEHLRVIKQVKKNEIIYDLFAGVGPFAVPIAKIAKKVIAIDINRSACKFLEENARINKVSEKIETYCGDSRKIAAKKRWKHVADRVIMNLPMHAGEFLDIAFRISKKNAIVYFYFFLPEEELFNGAIKIIECAARKAKRKIKIINKRKCGQLSPRVWRVVIDFKILN
jgi:tRNA (guanine37-N1)-methyltransferase